ncbi:hypothetical protein C0J52_08566, partial [Blattella germanica]
SYIQPCALNEPNFYECSLEHAKAAIPTFAKGLKKYGIPSFIPLEIPEIKIENGPSQAGINLHLKNVKVFDVEHSQNVFEITAPLLTVIADYEISGRLLLLPITGHGTINVTGINYKLRLDADSNIEERDGVRFGVFFNPRLTGKPSKEFFTLTNLFNGDKLLVTMWIYSCSLVLNLLIAGGTYAALPLQKNGERFARFSNPRTTLSSSRDYFNLTNLFNGDKFLGEEMNRLLNDNWRDAHKDLVAFIVKGVGELITSFIDKFGTSYIKPCARTDPQFHQCALDHAREVIPHLVNGDRKYGFPALEPLEIAEMRLENGPNQAGINLRMTDVKAYGVSRVTVSEIHYDIENSINYFNLTFPRMEILSDYEIKGRVLLLPIVGRGKLNATLVDINAVWEVDSKIEEKKGEKFVKFTNPRTTVSSSRDYFNLTNLFNGDKFLSDEMNHILNDNWQDAHKDLVVPVLKGVGELIASYLNNFASHVTYDTWFPEKL